MGGGAALCSLGLPWLYPGRRAGSPEGLEEVEDSGLCPSRTAWPSAALPAPCLHAALRPSRLNPGFGATCCQPGSPSALLGVLAPLHVESPFPGDRSPASPGRGAALECSENI